MQLVEDHGVIRKTIDLEFLEDFKNFLWYTKEDFWDVVEHFWNTDIFKKDVVSWKMKIPRFPE